MMKNYWNMIPKPKKIVGRIAFPFEKIAPPIQKIVSPFRKFSYWLANHLFGEAKRNQIPEDPNGNAEGANPNAADANPNAADANQMERPGGQNNNQNDNRNPDWMGRGNPEDYDEFNDYIERERRVIEPNGVFHDLSSLERVKQFIKKKPPQLPPPLEVAEPLKAEKSNCHVESEVSALYDYGKVTAAVKNKAAYFSVEKVLDCKKEGSIERQKSPAVEIVGDEEIISEPYLEGRSDVKSAETLGEVLNGSTIKEYFSKLGGQGTPIVFKLTEIASSDPVTLFIVGTAFIILHAILVFRLMKKNPDISKNGHVNTVLVIGKFFYSLSFFPVTSIVSSKIGEVVLNKAGFKTILSVEIVSRKHKAFAIFVTVSLFFSKIIVNGTFVELISSTVHWVARQPLKALYKSQNAPSKEEDKNQ